MGRQYIGIEVGDHAITHCVPRLNKVIEGEQGGVSTMVNWTGGGGFRFYRLGEPVFGEDGALSPGIAFAPLAAHIWFAETGLAPTAPANGPVLGVYSDQAVALLYNGVLGDRRPQGGNVLTRQTLAIIREHLPADFDGELIVYGERSALPYASRRRAADLNRAYAHVSEPTFYAAATALKDALVDMGFEDGEAEQAIEHPQLDLSEGLFAQPPRPPVTLDLISTPETRAVLVEHGLAPVESRPGVLTLTAPEIARPGLIDQIMHAAPSGAAELKQAVEALPIAPAARGAVIRVPALGTMIGGQLLLADLDLLMEHVDWRLSEQSPVVPGLAESLTETVRRYLIDVDGHQVTNIVLTGDLFEGADHVEGWTPARLVALLDPLVRDPSFTQADKVGWLSKVVARLIEVDGLSLAQLMRMRQALARKLIAHIGEVRRKQRAKTAQQYLLDPGAPVQALSNEAFAFRYGVYDDQPTYRGPIGFNKHLLDRVPAFDGKADGEEPRCAQMLDSLKQVKHWVRNVARHPASFWLQTSTQRTYPDFVAELTDGRIFVVEYKGADHWADAAEDRAIGEVWARATGNLYLMVRAKDDHGRAPLAQLMAHLD